MIMHLSGTCHRVLFKDLLLMDSYKNMSQRRDTLIHMMLFADNENREIQKYYLSITEYFLKFHYF